MAISGQSGHNFNHYLVKPSVGESPDWESSTPLSYLLSKLVNNSSKSRLYRYRTRTWLRRERKESQSTEPCFWPDSPILSCLPVKSPIRCKRGMLEGDAGGLPTRLEPSVVSLAGHLEDALCQSLHVSGGYSCNRNATILGGVDRVLLSQHLHLLRFQTGKGKHADLCCQRCHGHAD